MSFKNFVSDCNNGLKRSIKSRRHKKVISPFDFSIYVKTYFQTISKDENFQFTFKKLDLENLKFILRFHYRLWIEIFDNKIEIFKKFPIAFKIINEVNKINHHHVPKTFRKNTIVYLSDDCFSSCNWLNGIPLWDKKNIVYLNDLKPSCQINYDYITKYQYEN